MFSLSTCALIITGNLIKELHDLENNFAVLTDDELRAYDNIRIEQLKEIDIEREKGSIIRSRAQWVEEGEKPTRYFYQLEKSHANKKNMSKLTLKDGTEIDRPEDIS